MDSLDRLFHPPTHLLLSNFSNFSNKLMLNCLQILVIGMKRQHFLTMKLKPVKFNLFSSVSCVSGTLKFFSETPYLLICYLWSTDYWHWKVHQAARVCWGCGFGIGGGPNGVFVVETYELHNEWVREAARRNGNPILEWQPQQGWEPICKFLGKEVPSKPFPYSNDENTIRVLTAILVKRG
jgi:hypothetical protein